MYRRILIPVHGGPLDREAIDLAAAISSRSGKSETTLIYVVEIPQKYGLDTDLHEEVVRGEAILDRAAAYARSVGNGHWQQISTELLQARVAASAIVDEAIEWGADAVVVASCNRQRWGKLSQGSTVPYVLDNAPCAVLLVRSALEDGS